MNQSLVHILLVAAALTPVLLLVGYYFVLPAIVTEGYRRGLSSTQFSSPDGSEGAGSIDLEYFTLYFDVRKSDLVITGQAPQALHWQVGAFNGMVRLIDGAYVNQNTVALDETGKFTLTVTSHPGPVRMPNVLDCSSRPQGMIIFRVVLAEQPVVAPSVGVVKIAESQTGAA